jgi:hypothetical protein
MSAEQPTYLDLEFHLRDAQRLAVVIRELHASYIVEDNGLSIQERNLLMEVLLDRLHADTQAAVDVFDKTLYTAAGNVVRMP